jgi:PII-like signaling protein
MNSSDFFDSLTDVLRLEILAAESGLAEICDALESLGARGYTIYPNLQGWGDRGRQRGDEIDGVSGNIAIVCLCEHGLAERAMKKLVPMLAHRGGLCSVTPVKVMRKLGA